MLEETSEGKDEGEEARKTAARALRVRRQPSPIQTLTVGPGITPGLRIAPLAGYTAGGDFHPAPKVSKARISPECGRGVKVRHDTDGFVGTPAKGPIYIR